MSLTHYCGDSPQRPEREANHSPPSTEVKNTWSYTAIPQYAFIAWCSVKAQEQVYLTFDGN
jgi:hypothetical protein